MELPVGQRVHAVVQQVADGTAVLRTLGAVEVDVRVAAGRLRRGVTVGDRIALVADPAARDGVYLGPPDSNADPEVQRRRHDAGDRLRTLHRHRAHSEAH